MNEDDDMLIANITSDIGQYTLDSIDFGLPAKSKKGKERVESIIIDPSSQGDWLPNSSLC